MKKMTKISISFLLLVSVMSSHFTYGQFGPITALVAGKQVKDILREASTIVDQKMSNASLLGDALLSKGANELNVSIQNATLLFDKELTKTFDQLDTESQKIIGQIVNLRLSVERATSQAYDLKDALIIDLKSVTGEIAFWSRESFYVQRISGLSQMEQQNDYVIKIIGIGFGTDSEKKYSRITNISLNDKQSISFLENKIAANQSEIRIDYRQMNDFLVTTKPNLIKCNITIEVTEKRGLFKQSKTKKFELPFQVTLFPKFASELTIEYEEPIMDWVKINDMTYQYTTPNHGQTGSPINTYYYSDEKVVPMNQRFAGPTFHNRTGTGCPWTSLLSLDILENNTKLRANFSTHGLPCTYTYGAVLQEYKLSGTEQKSKKVSINYGEQFTFDLPTGVTLWRMTGSTTTFKKILIIGKNSAPSLIDFQNVVVSGSKNNLIYFTQMPGGLSY